MYPVDIPAVDDSDLRSASEHYLSSLESRCLSSDNEWFQSSQKSKVAITPNNISWLQVFEDDQPEFSVLALHPPDHPTQVVALHLYEKWWCVNDVLRTSSESRSGLVSVQTIMERLIVFLLSQVVERPSQEEVLFTLHPRTESCKLLWRDGQAVGFYTIKHKGSLCDSWSARCYLLPVLDTVLVRRSQRRRGFGFKMLEDFCSSFSEEDTLGVSAPLSPSMVAVCRRFLQLHQEDRERLYEIEAPGGWTERRNIWLNIRLGRYSSAINEENNPASLKNEGDDLSEEIQMCPSEQDPASLSNCKVTIPLIIASSEERFKSCDPSQGGSSQSSETSGTEPPTRRPESLNTKHTLKSKPSLSTDPHRERPEAEETHQRAKRVRRT